MQEHRETQHHNNSIKTLKLILIISKCCKIETPMHNRMPSKFATLHLALPLRSVTRQTQGRQRAKRKPRERMVGRMPKYRTWKTMGMGSSSRGLTLMINRRMMRVKIINWNKEIQRMMTIPLIGSSTLP